MREIKTHRSGSELNSMLRIEVGDDPGPGGAPNKYRVAVRSGDSWVEKFRIDFQSQPLYTTSPAGTRVQVNQIDGLTNEVLLAIVADRLNGFQAGKFACTENGAALMRIQEAISWLQWRTRDRLERGVEGSLQP